MVGFWPRNPKERHLCSLCSLVCVRLRLLSILQASVATHDISPLICQHGQPMPIRPEIGNMLPTVPCHSMSRYASQGNVPKVGSLGRAHVAVDQAEVNTDS